MAKARVSNWRGAQLPLFHFPPWKGTWVEDQVDQQRSRSHLSVEGPPQNNMLWQFYGVYSQGRRARQRARSGEALGTELEWGNLSRRPLPKVLGMKAQGLGMQIGKEHDRPKGP